MGRSFLPPRAPALLDYLLGARGDPWVRVASDTLGSGTHALTGTPAQEAFGVLGPPFKSGDLGPCEQMLQLGYPSAVVCGVLAPGHGQPKELEVGVGVTGVGAQGPWPRPEVLSLAALSMHLG